MNTDSSAGHGDSSALACGGPTILCGGINHPKLQFVPDNEPEKLTYCQQTFSLNKGNWHSTECAFIADPALKGRCKQCWNLYNNFRQKRHPILYPPPQQQSQPAIEQQPPSAPESGSSDTTPIDELLLSNVEAVRERIIELISYLGEIDDKQDLSSVGEFRMLAQLLKIKEQDDYTFSINDQLVFVACNGCDKCFIKKQRANVSRTCKGCKDAKGNDKRYSQRKEDNAANRVAPSSTVPYSALDAEERVQRHQKANSKRKCVNKSLERVLSRLNESEEEIITQGKLLDHFKKAAEKVGNDKSFVEESIFQTLKQIESKSKNNKGDEITRESAKRITEEIAMHCRNFVMQARGKPTAVRYIPSYLGAALNIYLRCPKAAEQARSDGVLAQPSRSCAQKIKSSQDVADGFSPSCCIIQRTYRDGMMKLEEEAKKSSNGEWGQIGFDEMKITKGVIMNATTGETTGKYSCNLSCNLKCVTSLS